MLAEMIMLLAAIALPASLRGQGTPNEGFYHKGTGSPSCDQGELDRLRKDVANLQHQARDVQAEKRAAEEKLFSIKSGIYGWRGSGWRFANSLLKLGADLSGEGRWPQLVGRLSDLFGLAQATGSGLEPGASVEAGINWLGQAAKACSGNPNCWGTWVTIDGSTLSQASYELYQHWYPELGIRNDWLWQNYTTNLEQLEKSYEAKSDVLTERLEATNRILSWIFFAKNALELQNDVQDAAEVSDVIDRLQQRWNTIDAAIDSDIARIAPLVKSCTGSSAGGRGGSAGPRASHFDGAPSHSLGIALAAADPTLALLDAALRWTARPTLSALPGDSAFRFQYGPLLKDLTQINASVRDAQSRMDRSVIPALAPFAGGGWQRMDHRFLLIAIRMSHADVDSLLADLHRTVDAGQRVLRSLGTGADVGLMAGGRLAVTPLSLGGTVSFASSDSKPHAMSLQSIDADGRHVRIAVHSAPAVIVLAVGDSATLALGRWGSGRVRVTLKTVCPFGIALVELRALPRHILVDLDGRTIAILVSLAIAAAAGFALGVAPVRHRPAPVRRIPLA